MVEVDRENVTTVGISGGVFEAAYSSHRLGRGFQQGANHLCHPGQAAGAEPGVVGKVEGGDGGGEGGRLQGGEATISEVKRLEGGWQGGWRERVKLRIV